MSATVPKTNIPSLSVEQTVINAISTLSAMHFTYGIYVMLFGTYLYITLHTTRNETGGRRINNNLYLTLTIVLFLLSTLFVANFTFYVSHASVIRFTVVKNEDYDLFARYQFYDDFERRFGFSTQGFLAVFLNVTAEWMLIHQCYVIWGSHKLVLIPLIMISASINACGFVVSILKSIGVSGLAAHKLDAPSLLVLGNEIDGPYGVASLVNNLIITLLTAGRIWWINRQVRAQDVHTSDNLVQTVSRLIVESGMIYPLVNVVDLVILNVVPQEKICFDAFPLVVLSAGIAPTLIMVRAKLGKNVESSQALSEIQFNNQPAQRGIGETSTIRSQAQGLSIGGFENSEEQARNARSKRTTVIV